MQCIQVMACGLCLLKESFFSTVEIIVFFFFLAFDLQMKRMCSSTEESGCFSVVRSESRENFRLKGKRFISPLLVVCVGECEL